VAKADTDAAMLERLQQEAAEGWNPDEGETLLGVILNIKSSQQNEYGIYPIVTVQTDEGKVVAIHCFHQVLKQRLLEKRPAPGEKLAVQYIGEVDKGEDGRSYHNYAVVVDRPTDTEAQATWDMFSDSTTELPVDEG